MKRSWIWGAAIALCLTCVCTAARSTPIDPGCNTSDEWADAYDAKATFDATPTHNNAHSLIEALKALGVAYSRCSLKWIATSIQKQGYDSQMAGRIFLRAAEVQHSISEDPTRLLELSRSSLHVALDLAGDDKNVRMLIQHDLDRIAELQRSP